MMMDLPKGVKITHTGLLQHNSDGTTEIQKLTQAGLVARSPEGTAAKGMNIRGNEDLWVEIQANTFRNWVNEHLRDTGTRIDDFMDFCDGTVICALVENLQKRSIKPWTRNPGNQHLFLENATTALKSIEEDGVKLVNIGNVDIVNGNVKLILGLIWSLIVRYQIGRSKFPPRKLMLAWLQAALPECKVNNLTTDWNSGVLLSALLDYCEPGLFPHWRSLDPSQAVRNCENAMNIAQRQFGVPKVLEPEYLASPWLDELSGMTYLSYFMKVDGPGYNASMRWVNSEIRNQVRNFTTDWNDGKVLCEIMKKLGGNVPGPEKLSSDPYHWENNIKKAVDAGSKLGARVVLQPKDMANPEVEHLGVMAYATQLQWITPRPPLADMLKLYLESTSGRIGDPIHFRVETLTKELELSQINAFIVPPQSSMHNVRLDSRGDGVYIPEKYGMHEIVLEVGEDRLGGHFFRVLPRLIQVAPPGMAPCSLGSLVEVLVNTTGAPKTEEIEVTAYSPTGRSLRCPLKKSNEGHSAIFKPDEAGIWEISITYQGRNIQGGPFTCSVFDASGVSLHGLDGAMPLRAHSFEVDARGVGVSGELHVDIVHEKRSLVCSVEKLVENKYRVTFMPRQNGKHRVYVYFNGYDVKGSPFIMRVGTGGRGRSGKTRSSPSYETSKHRSESPSILYNQLGSKLNIENYLSRKEVYSPQQTQKSSSYSPQLSPKPETDFYKSGTNRENYVSRFSTTPKREVYSPKNDTDLYSSSYKSEVKKMPNKSPSPINDSYHRDSANSSYTLYSENYSTRQRHDSHSPIAHVRDISSPITLATTSHYETSRNMTSSPRNFTASASPRNVSSPINYSTTTIHRISSPVNANKPNSDSYKLIKETTTFRSPIVQNPRFSSPSMDGVDYTSNVKVTAQMSSSTPSRRDSRDVINKTKHLLSHVSLESLANMTETQLNTDLSYTRSKEMDTETVRNTNYNKYNSLVSEPRIAKSSVDNEIKSYKYFTDTKTTSNTMTTSKEKNENYSLKHKDGSYIYGTSSNFRTIDENAVGSQAIRVQDIPDGVIGRSVQFEIDGSKAGSGNLEILVNGGRVTSAVRALGGQRFLASFIPHESGTHTIEITFNGETVPGSPWHVEIMSSPGLTALGDSTRLVSANSPAVFELLPSPGTTLSRGECIANVLSPSKSKVNARVSHEAANGAMRIEFIPTEVGTHIIEASLDGTKLVGGPLIAKVYDASLIQVTDVNGGIVGQPCQFRVDASAAGEGQLEISINEGEVPNHVQVVGGGRCLVSFTPEQAKPHLIDIKFNGETITGCPFVCAIADTSRVLLNLSNLELIPVSRSSSFHISVSGGGAAELAVSVKGPHGELPVRVTGDIHAGFTAEFTPLDVGAHSINVEYNGYPVQGTPFLAKAYNASKVAVGSVTKGTVGRPVQFTVDAGDAGEGNLEITISAKGHNIPTQVHPQGNAKFSVSFIPAEACEHIINVSFNKMAVPGCPILIPGTNISGGMSGPQVSLGGPGPVHTPNTFTINHPGGRLEDIEVNVEGPNGHSVPAQIVHQTPDGVFKAEFVPRNVGEHRVSVSVKSIPTAGSPYSAKVYDVDAIKVKNVTNGTVGKPVTFLVETSQAGPGNLEVTVNGGRVPTSAQAQGQHTYAISFTPRDAQHHTVELRFNGKNVPGSPFTCKVSAAARILSLDTLDKVSVGKLFYFLVESDIAPVVEILGPARRSIPSILEPFDKNYKIKFEPIDVGDHSIEVRLPNGGHVEGSPFLLKAYSAEKVIVSDIKPGVVGKSVSFGINASQAGAGNLEIIVAVGGKNVPNFVQSEGNARFKVNFKPLEAATHSLSVRFNSHAVPGSPFACFVSPSSISLSKAIATGEVLRQAPIKVDNLFELEGFEGIEPQVLVTSPTGDSVPCETFPRDEIFISRFRPTCVGRHLISVTANDQHINGSPFSCNVFDVSRVTISGLEQENGPASMGIPITFSVDAAGAGEGTLELVVSTDTSTVKAEVMACRRGLYDVTFIPQSCEWHFVNITFNDIPVDGSPFKVEVQQNIQHTQLGNVSVVDLMSENQTLEITGPDNKPVPFVSTKKLAEFQTQSIGTYIIRYIDRESRTTVATRTVNVFDPTMVKIVEVGEAICHRPATIGISMYDAGQGTLTANVMCASNDVPHTIRGPSKNGTWEIVYHPTQMAPHKVNIMFNGVSISAKCIEINVLPPHGKEINVSGLGLYQSRVGKTTSFAIDTAGRQAREFDVVVSGPGRIALPVRCYQTKSGHLLGEFNCTKVGQCVIDVLHQSKHLPGSPFTCNSFDPTKVVVQNFPKGQLAIHSAVLCNVNTQDSGTAELEISVQSPIGQILPIVINKKDEYNKVVEFMPTIPGHYKMTVLYGGEMIKNSPFTFAVSSTGSSDAHASGNGLEVALRGKENSFIVYCATSPNVQIERNDEKGERIEPKIKSLGNNEWRIVYNVLSVGNYEIRASCPSRGPLPGSPWHISCIDIAKITPIGGWGQLLDDEGRLVLPARVIFDTSQAGPGELVCTIDGKEIPFDKHADGRYRIYLSGEGLASGEHSFDLTYSGMSVSQSPVAAFISSQQAADKVVLTGRGLTSAQVGEPAHFTIDASDSQNGKPEVFLTYQDGAALAVTLSQPRLSENIWLATYTPVPASNGTLNLVVKWCGRIVRGCPFSIVLGSSVDASKVLCSGEGLRNGVVGREIKSWIDTRRAGPGELTAHCTGPRKVAYCELYDHGDATFTLNIKPQEPGRHSLTIKYGGQHVQGSPFSLRVAGSPDPSKVKVFGPGIEHGVLATFQSRFICDTRGAGAGQLTVRVRGPKGAFRVEMQRESQKDRTILCKYDPTEPGDYRVEVKWAGELVPGSPFPVMIFDTQEELRRFIHAS